MPHFPPAGRTEHLSETIRTSHTCIRTCHQEGQNSRSSISKMQWFFFSAFLGLSGALVLLFWVCVHGKSQVLQSRSQANGPWRLCAVSSTPSRLLMAFLLRAFNHYKNKSVLDLPFAQITYEQKMEVLKNFILFLISGDFLTCCVCTVRLWLIMLSTIGLLSEITAVQDCLLYIQTEHLMTFKSVLFKYNHF